MDEGERFPRGLPGTGSLLLIWVLVLFYVLVEACCVWCRLLDGAKRARQQLGAWISRAGS